MENHATLPDPSPKDLDTSQKGREEEVVNQQEQRKTTNSDIGDTTNSIADGNSLPEKEINTQSDEAADAYAEGMGNNDDRKDKEDSK